MLGCEGHYFAKADTLPDNEVMVGGRHSVIS